MAKKSKIARNEQRKIVVERYAEKRLALKKALVDPNSTDAQREEARLVIWMQQRVFRFWLVIIIEF